MLFKKLYFLTSKHLIQQINVNKNDDFKHTFGWQCYNVKPNSTIFLNMYYSY